MTHTVLVYHLINGVLHLDATDAAACLKISRQAVNRRLQTGTLSSQNIRGKHYIPCSEVEELTGKVGKRAREEDPPGDADEGSV